MLEFKIENIDDREKCALDIGAEEFLKAIAGEDAEINFRVFEDKKSGIFKGAKFTSAPEKLGEVLAKLKQYNERELGVFAVINSGGQTAESITKINAQFMECDSGTFAQQCTKLRLFKLVPSIVVMTEKSLHTYWLMKDGANIEDFTPIQKALAKHFDGDPAICDKARVMRVPGFYHHKKAPVKVVCIWFHPELRYTQDELRCALKEDTDLSEKSIEKTSEPTEKIELHKGIENVLHCNFVEHCRKNAETLTEPQWYAMITNLVPLEGGEKMIHELSKDYPKYSESETQDKIGHAKKSGAKPHTCEKIRDFGFDCPKLKEGGCGVKSPAALCHKPPTAEVLADILSAQPVSGDELKDTESAENFIHTHMKKATSAVGKVFIENNIRKHFGLDEKTAKELVKVFKAMHKKAPSKTVKEDELPPWYTATDCIPVFMPGILAEHLRDTTKIIHTTGQYYGYKDGVYLPLPKENVQSLIKSKMITRYTKANQIRDTEMQFRIDIVVPPELLNADEKIINLKNGLFDTKTKTLLPHTPDHLSTIQLPVSYDKKADCPLFRQYLADSMKGSEDQITLIQEMLGYFLVPATSAQKAFIIVGAAGAGKSILLRIIGELLLGKQNVSNVPWQALDERFKLAEIYGKLANIFADLPSKPITDNGIFKAVVGEDTLIAERKNQDPFSFKATSRLLFSCNSIPKNLGDRSNGFYRKLEIIRFEHTVPEDKKDALFFEKFRIEADGIFMFALEGLLRLMENNYVFSTTDTNKKELERYKCESDSALGFVSEECELSPEFSVGSTELYDRYKSYCEENGCRPYSHKVFLNQVMSNYPSVTKWRDGTANRRVLLGIRIHNNYA